LVLAQGGLLQHDADRGLVGQLRVAVRRLLEPRHDLEQRGLSGAVRAHDADLGSGIEGDRDVVEHDLLAERLAHAAHGVDELGHGITTWAGSKWQQTASYLATPAPQ